MRNLISHWLSQSGIGYYHIDNEFWFKTEDDRTAFVLTWSDTDAI